MTRSTDCKGREVGCTDDPPPGRSRCDNCREIHNAREAERRRLRRARSLCHVCGAAAVTVNGVALATCQVHREYFAARAAAYR